jgi:hypothetical protein
VDQVVDAVEKELFQNVRKGMTGIVGEVRVR